MSKRATSKRIAAAAQVTVVVSFRERWRFTPLTIESILRHTEEAFALWLLDAGMPADVRAQLQPQVASGRLTLVDVDSALQPNQWRHQIAPKLDSEFAVFIDNDVVVTPGWLPALLTCAEETGAGIVCPLYLWGEGEQSDLIHMAGGDLTLSPTDAGIQMTESHRHVMRKAADVPDDLHRRPCGFGEYHCLLMRREVYSAAGMFEPAIATVHEHIHASMLARELGFETWFEPAAQVNYLAFAPWQVGEIQALRTRWDFTTAENSLGEFAKRWGLVDDGEFRSSVHRFLNVHAGHSDLVDPRPKLGEARAQQIARTDLEYGFAGLQHLAMERGYDHKDIVTLRQAYRLAMALVDGLYRACGRPFLNHLAGTASVLLFYGCAMPQVLAGLLHAARTHGPPRVARQVLDFFKSYNPQAKVAARLVELYEGRAAKLNQFAAAPDKLSEMPVEVASLALIEAANEVEMHLSLEVAVSRRTDVLPLARLELHRTLLERVGLSGLADTLGSLGAASPGAMIPFDPKTQMSFRIRAPQPAPSPNPQNHPQRPVPVSAN